MDISKSELKDMQAQIGRNEVLTDRILIKLKALKPSLRLFKVYKPLLFERYDSVIPLLNEAIRKQIDYDIVHDLIEEMLASKYYVLRKAACHAIKRAIFPKKNDYIRNGLKDPIVEVVEAAFETLIFDRPFNETEMLEISMELFSNNYTAIRMLAIDILVNFNIEAHFITEILTSSNWRLRVKLASVAHLMPFKQKDFLIEELKTDNVDEVRIALSKNLQTIDHLEFLHDACDIVRGNYLNNILHLIQDEAILSGFLYEESWEVKKLLLYLKDDLFESITVPLILNSEELTWRMKDEIISGIERKINNETIIKKLIIYLISQMIDPVHEIRLKTQVIIMECIKRYNWIINFSSNLELITKSSNYLYRISIIPIAIFFDLVFDTTMSDKFINDPIVNVRDYYIDYVSEMQEELSRKKKSQ